MKAPGCFSSAFHLLSKKYVERRVISLSFCLFPAHFLSSDPFPNYSHHVPPPRVSGEPPGAIFRHTVVWSCSLRTTRISGQRSLLHTLTMGSPSLDLTESFLDASWALGRFTLSHGSQQMAGSILHTEQSSTLQTFITLAPHARLIFSCFPTEIVRITTLFSSQN